MEAPWKALQRTEIPRCPQSGGAAATHFGTLTMYGQVCPVSSSWGPRVFAGGHRTTCTARAADASRSGDVLPSRRSTAHVGRVRGVVCLVIPVQPFAVLCFRDVACQGACFHLDGAGRSCNFATACHLREWCPQRVPRLMQAQKAPFGCRCKFAPALECTSTPGMDSAVLPSVEHCWKGRQCGPQGSTA